jgi:hypothetical protein
VAVFLLISNMLRAINAESSNYYDEARAYLKKGDLNAAAIHKERHCADESNVGSI